MDTDKTGPYEADPEPPSTYPYGPLGEQPVAEPEAPKESKDSKNAPPAKGRSKKGAKPKR